MTQPEESIEKTTDTDDVLPKERGDEARKSPDTRREMRAELRDAMEETGTDREDLEEE
ncbi:hypothetical protein F4561_006139 [Lipingzhangella halophila]|uniref:Uncharacterized protein n=1 Tax=Lipingzhangella halophila TaxID=1783352 RepID=A0A7W7RNI0_9ACTN|nr:hypothetical protein [Lipingzhangella halophila]MBB4935245.1 hypothetical protein [Lipingzhangella halophila]